MVDIVVWSYEVFIYCYPSHIVESFLHAHPVCYGKKPLKVVVQGQWEEFVHGSISSISQCTVISEKWLVVLYTPNFEEISFSNAFTATTFRKGCWISSRRANECVINGYVTNQLVWILPYLSN